jgi:uncharacterized membrane protein
LHTDGPGFGLHSNRQYKDITMLKHSALATVIMALTLSLTACGGSSTKTTVNNQETQGKQLMDLKEAYDKGVITEKEYEKAKEDILDQ